MKNKDIIIIGMQPWDIEIGSNCKNIAIEFAKRNRVLYVNPPLDRYTILRKSNNPKIQKRLDILRNKQDDITRISDNLWNLNPRTILESINWIKFELLFLTFNKINNKRFAACIKDAADRIGFNNYILFNDNLILKADYFKELLNPDLYIYYVRDNLSGVNYFKSHALKAEEKLIASVDLIVSNSDFLTDKAKKFNRNSFMIGQGCDLSMYNDDNGKIKIADELSAIKKPIIGYTGFITSLRIDHDLLMHIAETHKDWSIVLIGPEDKIFESSKLHSMSNVHFLGNKKPEDLASYIKGFDVAVNPQLNNEITKGNYPRKIDEYLAMGKPTVATKTEFMDYFKDYTYLASSKEEFVNMIEKALKENNERFENDRKCFAFLHSWENSVKQIYNQVENLQMQTFKNA